MQTRKLWNAQMVDGRYIEVFKHSDAMIHDCGSFSLEYFYAHKPMMFLYENKGRKDKVHINDVTKEAKSNCIATLLIRPKGWKVRYMKELRGTFRDTEKNMST